MDELKQLAEDFIKFFTSYNGNPIDLEFGQGTLYFMVKFTTCLSKLSGQNQLVFLDALKSSPYKTSPSVKEYLSIKPQNYYENNPPLSMTFKKETI